jgi:hypothetical protein
MQGFGVATLILPFIFIIVIICYLKQTTFLGRVVLQLFRSYNLWRLGRLIPGIEFRYPLTGRPDASPGP